ncbi:MAG: site-specific DNA-methyltransferase [Synergistaceae bacterium]|jgi:adenine-specific DNA-methyltransferase|nr:site-specific DNA-methyltransferase [Synergistaceae bacterium]
MDKLKFETPDLTAKNVAKLAELFPGVVAEGKVNIDLLRAMLGEDVFTDEAYEFTWVGKRAAIAEAGRPIRKTLRPCVEESKNWDTTENLYIEGDNLDVLKLLQESYLGKVKMIYIDPPYNTGSDFIYRDNFAQSREDYDEEAGVYDEYGDRLYRNTESNGRFHSDWCSMIYPRLVLARNLLSSDGVIFISIDEGEAAQLRKICDEVFGEENFLVNIVWEKRYTRSNNARLFTTLTEPVLCYRKSNTLMDLKEPRNAKADSIYSNPDDDPRGVWTSVSCVNPATREQRPNLTYDMKNPFTGETVSHPTNAWKFERVKYLSYVEDNKLYWGKNGENKYPRLKKFLSEMDGGMVPVDLWRQEYTGTTDTASKELEALIGKSVFTFPKPPSLIKRMLGIAATGSGYIVLDFFSGSATTAHAVMQLNAEDGGRRKFIMVQLPEVCAEGTEAAKAGYSTICEIGKERIRRAGEKIVGAGPCVCPGAGQPRGVALTDIGFRVFKLDSTNMNDVYYSAAEVVERGQTMLFEDENNIKPDRTDMDLLFGCLLEWGLPLSMPHTHEKIDGFTVHTYNCGDLIACFEEKISETTIREIAGRNPLRAVFRDSSFTSSPEKINVFEIFKLLSPTTKVKVI